MRKLFALIVASLVIIPLYANAIQCGSFSFDGTDNDEMVGYVGVNQLEPASAFTASTTCDVTSIGMRISHSSGRTEDGFIVLYNNGSGTPGSQLEAGSTITGTATYPTYGWATSTFGGTTRVTAGSTYWVSYKSASTNNSLYLLASGGNTGTCKNWNGTDWTTHACNAASRALVFTVTGNEVQPTQASKSAGDIITFDF